MISPFARPHIHFFSVLALASFLIVGAVVPPAGRRAPRHAVTGDGTQTTVPQPVPAKASAESERQTREAYAKLGVSFEENRGQADKRALFLTRYGGATVFLTNDASWFILRASSEPMEEATAADKKRTRYAVQMKIEGANPRTEVIGERQLEGRANYFRSNDPENWVTDVPTYRGVRYREIYQGVDLVYYGTERGELEYDFRVAAGGDASQISLQFSGADELEVETSGDLVIKTPVGSLRQHKPVVYQEEEGGGRREVESRYAVTGNGCVGFALGEYDPSRTLIIDPVVLTYSTFLGGSNTDFGHGIAVDSAGNAYVIGETISTDFPATSGAFDPGSNGNFDVFVAKLNASGSALVYATFLGGSGFERGLAIAVDSASNAYVTGFTPSGNFPVTTGAFDTTANGGEDVFVTKLNATGSALVYSTFLGGSSADQGNGIAIDSARNAYVTGSTGSSGFPVSSGALDTSHNGGDDVFVAKLNATGTALVYSTFLGGSGNQSGERGIGVAVDSAGNAYLTGVPASTGFPTTSGAFDTTTNGNSDVFVTKLNGSGSALVYSTFLGGSTTDSVSSIAVDSAGSAYVTGDTSSSDFPVTSGAFDTTFGDWTDVFVTKLNPSGSALAYSTFLGGNDDEASNGIAVDSAGNAYVTGETDVTGLNETPDFPVTSGAFDTTYNGGQDAFVTKFNASGSALVYSTFLGSSGDDEGTGIAVDSAGNAYVVGDTPVTDFPTTSGAFDTTYNGGDLDAFVAKLTDTTTSTPTPTPKPTPTSTPTPTPTPTPTATPTVTPTPIPLPGDACLDSSFHTDGRVLTNFSSGSKDSAADIVIQPDGKVIAVGLTRSAADTGNFTLVDFALARYNINGSLDSTFGAGGVVATDFNGKLDKISAVVIQPDGKIIVAGSVTTNVSVDFALVRYNANGSIDTTFGTNGRVLTDFNNGRTDEANAVVLQPNGKIIAAGYTLISTTFNDAAFALVRYNANGSLDATFGTNGNGKVINDFSSQLDIIDSIALQSDGRLVVIGVVNGTAPVTIVGDSRLVRYNANGSLDTSFAGGGVVTDNFAGQEPGTALLIQSGDKIIVGGSQSSSDGTGVDFALARYSANGLVDTTFGTNGKVVTDFLARRDLLRDIVLQPDGKIIAAGGVRQADGNEHFGLARFGSNGTLDTSFGVSGKIVTDFFARTDSASAVAVQSSGRIVAAGGASNTNSSAFALARYLPACGSTPTPSQLLNIATRLRVQTGENVLIGGFIITGTEPKKVIIRGIGPSLSSFFSGVLANPTLELHQGNTLLGTNDDWIEKRAEIEATGLQPSNNLESAIVRTLAPGNYTAIVRGKGGATGIGVVEAYDLNQAANSKLANIATRGFVNTDDNVMIGGLIVGPTGAANTKVVVRAIGPSLAQFGINGALQNPTLDLVNSSGTVIRSNDNWKLTQRTEIEALNLQPSDDRESALVQTLAPGNYTAIVRGNGNTTGVGLVEVYNVD